MGTWPPGRVAELARRTHAALAQDQLALAEELLLRLIAAAPEEPTSAVQLATLYQRRGQHGLAIAFAQRAAALDPDDPHHARLLGSALEAGGEPELARAAYLAAESNPRHAQPWLTLARLERAQGRLGTAEQYARRAVEAAPHDAAGYVELARVLVHGGQPQQALAALVVGLRRAPDAADLRALHDALAAAPATEGSSATSTESHDTAEGWPRTDPSSFHGSS